MPTLVLKLSESFSQRYNILGNHKSDSEFRWKNPKNPYRQSPFLIEKLPTIVKVSEAGVSGGQCWIDDDADHMEWTRLVEGDCYDQKKLDAFIDS